MEALAGDAVDSAALAGRAVLGPVQESGPACLPGIPGSIPGSELSILSLLVPRTACSSRRRGPEAEPGCGRHPIWGLVVARAGAGAGALPGSPGTRIPRGLTYWLLRPLTQVLFSACLSPIQAPALLTCRASTDCYRLIPSWIKPLRLAPGLQGPFELFCPFTAVGSWPGHSSSLSPFPYLRIAGYKSTYLLGLLRRFSGIKVNGSALHSGNYSIISHPPLEAFSTPMSLSYFSPCPPLHLVLLCSWACWFLSCLPT